MKDCLSDKEKKLILLGEMFENIIHQLKQPLNAINIEATGIKFQNEIGMLDEKELDEALDNIINTINFLSNTIDDFRNFVKEEKGKHTFDLINTINNIEKILSPLFKASGIRLIKQIKDKEILINGFNSELSQVLLNILNNARDQLKKQKNLDEKLVFLDIEKKDKEVIIKIYDNGGGIEEEILPKIFEYKFTTKGNEGTGLGLYMSKQIMEKYFNGDIKAKNIKFEYEGIEYRGAEFEIVISK